MRLFVNTRNLYLKVRLSLVSIDLALLGTVLG
ncbi:hypothetical protein BH23ACT11_BH23ACT11_11950 [soil metagenome]